MTRRALTPFGMDRHRVVVSGIGVVTPIGIGKDDFWEGLLTGCNGISRITLFDPTKFRSQMAGEVKDFCAEDCTQSVKVLLVDPALVQDEKDSSVEISH